MASPTKTTIKKNSWKPMLRSAKNGNVATKGKPAKPKNGNVATRGAPKPTRSQTALRSGSPTAKRQATNNARNQQRNSATGGPARDGQRVKTQVKPDPTAKPKPKATPPPTGIQNASGESGRRNNEYLRKVVKGK